MVFDAKEVPARFVHGIQAEDWLACWNMREGTLASLDFTNQVEFGQPGVRALSIDALRAGDFGEVALSSRMVLLHQAAIARSGKAFGWGVSPYPRVEASQGKHEDVVSRADLELRMEEMRRDLAPDAPSRIGCLFLAEATPAGRTMISRIKGPEVFLMEVRIIGGSRLGRADSRWLEGRPGDEEIVQYWSGQPRDDEPIWEFLLDGVIKSTDDQELSRLRDWAHEAALRAHGTQGPIGTPLTPGPLRPQAPPRREGRAGKVR